MSRVRSESEVTQTRRLQATAATPTHASAPAGTPVACANNTHVLAAATPPPYHQIRGHRQAAAGRGPSIGVSARCLATDGPMIVESSKENRKRSELEYVVSVPSREPVRARSSAGARASHRRAADSAGEAATTTTPQLRSGIGHGSAGDAATHGGWPRINSPTAGSCAESVRSMASRSRLAGRGSLTVTAHVSAYAYAILFCLRSMRNEGDVDPSLICGANSRTTTLAYEKDVVLDVRSASSPEWLYFVVGLPSSAGYDRGRTAWWERLSSWPHEPRGEWRCAESARFPDADGLCKYWLASNFSWRSMNIFP